MRKHLLLILCCIGLTLTACDRQESPSLTPEQQQMETALLQASIANSEQLLGRPLTDREKRCIIVEFENGYPTASISAPLSETMLARRDELARQHKASESSP